MGKLELLRDLREKTGGLQLIDRQFWKAPHLASGVPRGIVAELAGQARTEWLLELFKMHPEPLIFWCEREQLAHPTAIHQRGVRLERIKFINSAGDLQQPIRMALESRHYPFIVAPNRFTDIRIFQRFHLLAEKAESTLFLLADKKLAPAWPISLQLEINSSDQGFEIEIHRQKYGSSSSHEAAE